MWGWGLWTDRVFLLSSGLAQRTPNNDNNNNNNIFYLERLCTIGKTSTQRQDLISQKNPICNAVHILSVSHVARSLIHIKHKLLVEPRERVDDM